MALIQANYASACLKRTVIFNAIIPIDNPMPGAPQVKLPLKTLYLLHGYTGSSMDWLRSESVGNLAAEYNLAIIMPDGENHFYVDDTQRGDKYGEYISRELLDYTRRIFPLSRERGDTIIGGISMGGYGALRNGLKYSDVFGHVIAISPAIVTGEFDKATDEPNSAGATRGYFESVFGDLSTASERDIDIFWLSEKMAKEGTEFPDIYCACGRNDMLVFENRRFCGHLDKLSVPHVYEESPGTHDALFFNPHLKRGLDRLPLDRNPQMPNPFWIDE